MNEFCFFVADGACIFDKLFAILGVHFDVVAKHIIMANFQCAKARLLGVSGLQLSNQAAAVIAHQAQLIELS